MKNLDELSFSTRWKAGIERAKRGPSKKAVPTIFRKTGKKAKNLQKKFQLGQVRIIQNTPIELKSKEEFLCHFQIG